MKYILFILFISCPIIGLTQQSYLTDNDWDKITTYLDKENWDSANKSILFFLKKYTGNNKNTKDAALLRYMYIVSEAGILNEGKIDKEQAWKAVKIFIELKVILPGHPLSTKRGFNLIQPHDNSTDTLFITESNKTMDQIFCFEYVIPEKKITIEEFNKNINMEGVIEGVLSSISVEGYILPRYKLYIDKATIDFYPLNK